MPPLLNAPYASAILTALGVDVPSGKDLSRRARLSSCSPAATASFFTFCSPMCLPSWTKVRLADLIVASRRVVGGRTCTVTRAAPDRLGATARGLPVISRPVLS